MPRKKKVTEEQVEKVENNVNSTSAEVEKKDSMTETVGQKVEETPLVYVGGNVYYIQGVPARDLTADEVEKHGGSERLLAYPNVYERPPEPVEEVSKPEEKES